MTGLLRAIAVTTVMSVGGTGLGGWAGAAARTRGGRTEGLMAAFSAGVMTGVVCFDLLPEALHPAAGGPGPGFFTVAAGAAAGYLTVWLLCLLTAARPGRNGAQAAGYSMAGAIALHNVPEGVIVGAAFASGGNAARSALVLAAVIGLHDVPEGMAVALPLRLGGASRGRAALAAAIAGAATVPGAALGYGLGSLSPGWLSLSLSFASGAMLCVVCLDLLPEALRRKDAAAAAIFAAGLLLGLGLLT